MSAFIFSAQDVAMPATGHELQLPQAALDHSQGLDHMPTVPEPRETAMVIACVLFAFVIFYRYFSSRAKPKWNAKDEGK